MASGTPPQLPECLDATNLRSPLRYLSAINREKILTHYETHPEYFTMDEKDLLKTLRFQNRTPTATDNRIRFRFWDQVDRANGSGSTIVAAGEIIGAYDLCAGVCSTAFFHSRYMASPEKVAWMLCAPANYMAIAQEALAFGLEQMRDILAIPHKDPTTGKLNERLMGVKRGITAMLDLRVKGAPVQKNLNLTANLGTEQHNNDRTLKGLRKPITEMTMEELQKQLKDLHDEDRISQHIETTATHLPALED